MADRFYYPSSHSTNLREVFFFVLQGSFLGCASFAGEGGRNQRDNMLPCTFLPAVSKKTRFFHLRRSPISALPGWLGQTMSECVVCHVKGLPKNTSSPEPQGAMFSEARYPSHLGLQGDKKNSWCQSVQIPILTHTLEPSPPTTKTKNLGLAPYERA